ncbi:AAA family ATPase [Prevotella communis]|uniref:ATP-dependent DNA helicase n=1 Tax=Prevotella communis TaxID=2913614 RepID=UPI001EDBBD03|nr:AAA family ATPase [Prevotella communis]UKK58758.1 AAA family ATPase [Prevotella communis]UKK66697.1 AAA family ATPase [Prevotella communis]UKK71163.1 AAA family ATPase [Prevotella communis]
MIQDELIYQIETHFGHLPTPEQHAALQTFATFMTDRDEQVVMVLRGSAGTGKTTLASAIVRGMLAMKQKLVLMAPTGRAAKVFSNYSGTPAYTIHRRIYRQKTAADLSAFSLGFNAAQDTLFIVDEASMIANADTPLLDDLIRFVYNYKNCRLLLIGDRAQLPPVGEEESPALIAHVLRGYGMNVYEADLTEVLRQAEDSGILWNATEVRCMMADGRCELPKIRLDGFPDIVSVPGDELIESLASSFSHVGMDETLVVTRSNKRANIYNQGIRNTVLDREDELCRGDRIMIVKNNYYWVKSEGIEGNISFIANGDIAVVQRVRNVQELYGFRFAEVTMTFPDYDDYELTAITLLDTLTTEAPALTREQQEQLYTQVMEDYMDVPYKSERLKKLKDDKYYNALQIKFAYAATCHKAQGGQWAHVYIDQGYMTDDMLTPDYFHWLYTALTRATEQVFLVNWPKTQVENPSDSY